MRFSPRFLNVFLRFPVPSFFSGVAPSGAAASVFAMSDDLLLRNGALARALARPRVGARPLAANRQAPAMTRAAVAADFHQPLDVHRDFLAQVALDAPLLLDDTRDLPHVLFREVLDAQVGTDAGFLQDAVRPDAPDAEDVGEPDFDALGARQINSCDTCHKN